MGNDSYRFKKGLKLAYFRTDIVVHFCSEINTYILASRWPDIIVGVLIAGLFLKSSIHAIRQAKEQM